jgi:hypothetical protein
MKKLVLTLALVSFSVVINAQTTEKENLKKNEEALKKAQEEKPNGWIKKGTFSFLANQATFNNWLAGGQSNVSGNIGLNYDFNYKHNNITWDNKLIAGYGLTKIKDQEMQKTDDRVDFNSLVGKKAFGNWYYSAFFNFKTQFDSGFDQDTGIKTSHLFSPAYFQFGPGILWKKSDNLKANIAPATSKLILVHDHFTQLGPSFGVEQGKTSRYEFGAALNLYYKFIPIENVTVEQIANFYSNYIEDPQNVDIDYQINIVMKINKYLSTNIAFQTIYDDNAFQGFQIRQTLGVGVNFGF